MGARPTEVGEDAIAHELRNVPFETSDLARNGVLKHADNLPHVLGIEPLAQSCRAHKIDEHNRKLAALPFADLNCARWFGADSG
jgi:hypothetical protein